MSYLFNMTGVESAAGASYYNITYPLAMPFEYNFPVTEWVRWFDSHWSYVFFIIVPYMAIIFGLQKWMENRPPYKIRKVLFVWNMSLALFSMYGGSRSLQEFLYVYKNMSFYSTYCLCGPR